MSNMQDFIRWRGDLPFSAVPVGEVDGLILAQLAENPELIDVSSGVEDAPGIKNHDKMRALFATIGTLR